MPRLTGGGLCSIKRSRKVPHSKSLGTILSGPENSQGLLGHSEVSPNFIYFGVNWLVSSIKTKGNLIALYLTTLLTSLAQNTPLRHTLGENGLRPFGPLNPTLSDRGLVSFIETVLPKYTSVLRPVLPWFSPKRVKRNWHRETRLTTVSRKTSHCFWLKVNWLTVVPTTDQPKTQNQTNKQIV